MTAEKDICLDCPHLGTRYRGKVLERFCKIDGGRVKWPQPTCVSNVRRELREGVHEKENPQGPTEPPT